MYWKVNLIICFIISLLIFSNNVPLAAQTFLKFNAEGALNLSSPIAIPEDLSKNGDSYKVHYVPGYDWAGILEINHKAIGIATGLGLKHINFNFERNFKVKRFGGSIDETLAIVRLKYWSLPVTMKANLKSLNNLIITLTYEFGWLVNDLNREFAGDEYTHELSKWFQSNANFLCFGIGRCVSPKTAVLFQIGFTPKYVEKKMVPLEGVNQGYFYFHKKLIELRLTINYNILKLGL